MSVKKKSAGAKAPVVKKIKPVKYDPNSGETPACFGQWVSTNRICHECWYAQECKKK